ncbi:MAG: hypothetical protein ACI3ZR_00975 [bacterium]
MLKGVCGNLCLDELFRLFSEHVVLMWAGKWDEAYAMISEITDNYNKIIKVLKEWFDMQ